MFPVGRNLLTVPFSCWLEMPTLGRNHPVDRAMRLIVLNFSLIRLVFIIEDLNLHADECRVPLERGANANAVIGAGRELELKAQDEVGVFLIGVDVAAPLGLADNGA